MGSLWGVFLGLYITKRGYKNMILSLDFRRVAAEGTELSSPDIRVSLEGYQKAMLLEMDALKEWIEEKKEKALNFKLSPEMIEQIKTELQGYSRLPLIMKWIEAKNPQAIKGEISKLWDWLLHGEGNRDRYMAVRQSVTTLMDFQESIDDLSQRYLPEAAEAKFHEIMAQTSQNMDKIEGLIRAAISRIPTWHGYPVVIVAEPNHSDVIRGRYNFEPAEDATVRLETGASYPPGFSIFMREDKNVDVDDILDAGDTDFFTDLDSQTDYFSLVNEIQKPGSTQKTKLLTLYTARPAADRETYENAQTLPVNIFLTNSFDHVLGLASDLAGSGGMRDIWRVKVDSRYLTQTLEGPVKYYQVTVPGAPVKSMELIYSEGE
jgi:hypothetical protein